MTATGTVYALIDPRDGKTRYIGQTKKQPFTERLAGGYAPRVRAWMDELKQAGLAPQMVAIREDVPVADLRAAEAEEITRLIVAGGNPLNDQVTVFGRKLLTERLEAERKAARRAGWRHLADAAVEMLGGPLPPGELALMEIPDLSWRYMSTSGPERLDHARSLLRAGNWRDLPSGHYETCRAVEREQEKAADAIWDLARYAWSAIRRTGGDSFSRCVERNSRATLEARCGSREDASRFLALSAWYLAAVHPWRHLAELAGLADEDATFIAWAGLDGEVREALTFLADSGMLERLSIREHCPQREKSPGWLLAAVAAAYSAADPPEAIRQDVAETLALLAGDHQVTQPMADLLLRLNPRALDDVFGSDIAAELDRELGLAAGTSGSVLRALVSRRGHAHDGVSRIADRSAQSFPVSAVPDYGDWSGPGVPAMRSISGCLVRAGLAAPDRMSAEEYLATVRDLWTSRSDDQRRQEAA